MLRPNLKFGTPPAYRKKDGMPKNDIISNSYGVRDTKYAFESHEKIENDPSDKPSVPNHVCQLKVDSYNEDDGIESFSNQGAQYSKSKNSRHGDNKSVIVNIDDRHHFYFSGGEGMSKFSGRMTKYSDGIQIANRQILAH